MKKLALITGGTSGLGLGAAQALAREYDLALAFRGDTEKAATARRQLNELAPDCQVGLFAGEVMNAADASGLVARVRAEMGRDPSVLVCSAGRLRDGLFMQTDFAETAAMLNEHLLVPMALAHACMKAMYRARDGRVVLLSSISARYAKRGQCGYAAAKSGIEGFVKTLALEVAHRGVTVNAVAPGLFETPMTADFMNKLGGSENLRDRIPVGRVGAPTEVGGLIRYLCSAEAAYITGTVVTIDGGRSLGDPRS